MTAKAASATVDASSDAAAAIVAMIPQPLLVLDDGFRVELANPAFLEQFGVRCEETVGRQLYELGDRQWDIPELRRLLEGVLSRDERVQGYRVIHDFERIGRKVVVLDARRVSRPGAPEAILLAIDGRGAAERTAMQGTRGDAEAAGLVPRRNM